MTRAQFVRLALCLSLTTIPWLNNAWPEDLPGIDTKLQIRVPQYTLDAIDFAHAIASIASRFNLPVGIEWVRSQNTLKAFHRSWKDATVQEILTAIVRSQPGYTMDVKGGIVHVFSRTATSRRLDFLDMTVDRFEMRNQIVEIGSRRLRDLVRYRMSAGESSHERRGGIVASQAANIGDPQFSFTLQNASVRQILDKLSLESDRKIWIVTYSGDNIAGTSYLRTMTLWNNSNVPDAEQPVWDMFRWTDTIP
jgi:hypothetical protein